MTIKTQPSAEEIIAKLGEPTRGVVERSLEWLDKTEADGITTPVEDRWKFIEGVLLGISKEEGKNEKPTPPSLAKFVKHKEKKDGQ